MSRNAPYLVMAVVVLGNFLVFLSADRRAEEWRSLAARWEAVASDAVDVAGECAAQLDATRQSLMASVQGRAP